MNLVDNALAITGLIFSIIMVALIGPELEASRLAS
jgi:ABC-type antimicrobial peptide transport system permease subunit